MMGLFSRVVAPAICTIAALAPGLSRAAEPVTCAHNLVQGGMGHILIAGTLFDGVPGTTNQLPGEQGPWDITQFRSTHPHHDVYLLCRYVGVPGDIRKTVKLPGGVAACVTKRDNVVCR
jgi:hypothetical protein